MCPAQFTSLCPPLNSSAQRTMSALAAPLSLCPVSVQRPPAPVSRQFLYPSARTYRARSLLNNVLCCCVVQCTRARSLPRAPSPADRFLPLVSTGSQRHPAQRLAVSARSRAIESRTASLTMAILSTQPSPATAAASITCTTRTSTLSGLHLAPRTAGLAASGSARGRRTGGKDAYVADLGGDAERGCRVDHRRGPHRRVGPPIDGHYY